MPRTGLGSRDRDDTSCPVQHHSSWGPIKEVTLKKVALQRLRQEHETGWEGLSELGGLKEQDGSYWSQ